MRVHHHRGDAVGQSIAAIARSFGVSESCLSRWLRIADQEDGIATDATAPPSSKTGTDLEAENRELRRIETACHRRRRQQSHGRLTPVELETLLDTAHAA